MLSIAFTRASFFKMMFVDENRIAKGKLAVWLAIEERVFSVELHLCMKRCCWREPQAQILKNLKAFLSFFSHKFT